MNITEYKIPQCVHLAVEEKQFCQKKAAELTKKYQRRVSISEYVRSLIQEAMLID